MIRALNAVALLALVWMFGILAVHYSDLPDQVPRHFNVPHATSRWAARSVVWLYPILGAHLFVLMTALSSSKISPDVRLILAIVKAIVLLCFAYILTTQMMAAMGQA